MTVNVERVTLWVEALESGKFKQTNGVLRSAYSDSGEATYCCLGVATEVAIANGYKPDGVTWYDSTLCSGVADWYGFELDDPQVGFYSDDVYLSGDPLSAVIANDDLHWDFPTIAASVRKLYLEPKQ